jgi:hypothetical protein
VANPDRIVDGATAPHIPQATYSRDRGLAIWTQGDAARLARRTLIAVGYDAAMPKLACWSCGRQIYTVAPLDALFAEERRCPRCGAFLNNDRRSADRRSIVRRQNPSDDPGPPGGVERRTEDRREDRRRKPAGS